MPEQKCLVVYEAFGYVESLSTRQSTRVHGRFRNWSCGMEITRFLLQGKASQPLVIGKADYRKSEK